MKYRLTFSHVKYPCRCYTYSCLLVLTPDATTPRPTAAPRHHDFFFNLADDCKCGLGLCSHHLAVTHPRKPNAFHDAPSPLPVIYNAYFALSHGIMGHTATQFFILSPSL